MSEARANLESDRIALAKAREVLDAWGPQLFRWNGMDLAASVLSYLFHGFYRPLVRSGQLPAAPTRRTWVGTIGRSLRDRLQHRPLPAAGHGGVMLLPAHRTHVQWLNLTLKALDRAGRPVQVVLPPGVDAPVDCSWPLTRLEGYVTASAVSGILRPLPLPPVLTTGWAAETKRVAAFLRRRWWPQLVVQAAAIHNALLRHRPAAIVVLEDYAPLGSAAIAAARRVGARCVNVQHGWMPVTAWAGPSGYDAWAVFGTETRHTLIAAGERPDVVVVTGPPHCDRITRGEFPDQQTVQQSLALPADQPERVLFVSQWGHLNNPRGVREASLRSLLAAVLARPLCHLIVKKHPVEHDSLVEEVVAGFPASAGRVTITRDYDLYGLLGVAQVVVTQYSSVGYEAALAGRPLLVVNFTGHPDVVPFVKDGIALGAYTPEAVRSRLYTLLDDPAARTRLAAARPGFIAHQCMAADGRASERLAALLSN